MIRAALRDLQWRRRRVAIALVATALVLTIAVVLTGLVAAIYGEADRATYGPGADAWMVASSSAGPFSAGAPFPVSLAASVAVQPGVEQAEAALFSAQAVVLDRPSPLVVYGVEPGGLADPSPASGTLLQAPGDAVVDERSGLEVGDRITLGAVTFDVVATVAGQTMLGGVPVLFGALADVQQALVLGQPVATALLVRGTAGDAPDGLKVMTNEQVRDDAILVLRSVLDSLRLLRLLMWIVAAAIVASVVYLSALERSRDFAVFKATGASTRSIGTGVVLQAVVVAVSSSLVAIGIAALVAPSFPIPVSLPARSVVVVPLVAAAVGAVASLAGIVRVVRAEPALAFVGA
jgi:putative ABC transport system permease protein